MIYSSEIYRQTIKKYEILRREAQRASEYYRQTLESDENYLAALNGYNSSRFDKSKAEYSHDLPAAKEAERKMKSFARKMSEIQKIAGITDEMLEPRYKCALCGDTGFTPSGNICKCFYSRASETLMEELGIEKRTLPDFDDAKYTDKDNRGAIFQKMREYCENFDKIKKFGVFYGEVGTGKTFLAACAANAIAKQDKTVLFLSAYELYGIFLRFTNSPASERNMYTDILTECDFLVIDDLGSEPATSKIVNDCLYIIISQRISRKKPFIITTNLDTELIYERYGDRIFSRLQDKTHGFNILLKGEDLRRIKRK